MSGHEVDGEGNVKVFTFTVKPMYKEYEDLAGDCYWEKKSTDYAECWDWARRVCDDLELQSDIKCVIQYDYDWIPEEEWDNKKERWNDEGEN